MFIDIPTVLLKDAYKIGHVFQYPPGTEKVYSNLTPRNSRRPAPRPGRVDGVAFFGLQYFIDEYLWRQFQNNFFLRPRDEVVGSYKRRVDGILGPDAVDVSHIAALHDLGYLPLLIKALPEGTIVPYGVPVLTIVNTDPAFFWLTNMLETLMSSVLWKASTSATTAYAYRQVFEEYARDTGSPMDFVQWQGHDFSFRGMCGVEDAAVSGGAHLLSFTGTDTIPAVDFLERYYGADSDAELVGGSVAATEHSVMCVGEPHGELETFRRLVVDVYPTGIVSVVSDTWDLWRVLTEHLPALHKEVMNRDGKLVIRPDSGDPVKIVCGDPDAPPDTPQRQGVVKLLWGTFGGVETSTGHRLLDPHVGVIYGDGISPERQEAILAGLADNGFASANVVLGLGSFTYQYVTRDTDGWAVKATAAWIRDRGLVEIFKDPVTDDGRKRSARGLLAVSRGLNDRLVLQEGCTPAQEREGLLEPVFEDGRILRTETLAQIRGRLWPVTA